MRSLKEYNAAVFGVGPDGAGGVRFGSDGFDGLERLILGSGVARSFASDVALLGGEEVGLRVTLRIEDGADPLAALLDLGAALVAAVRETYGVGIEVAEAEVLLQGRFEEREEKEAARSEGVSLVGQTDFAEILGVTQQRVSRLEQQRASGERDDFPAPADHTSGGPQWFAEDAERFARTWRRRPGRPPKTAGTPDDERGPSGAQGGAPAPSSGEWSPEELSRRTGLPLEEFTGAKERRRKRVRRSGSGGPETQDRGE